MVKLFEIHDYLDHYDADYDGDLRNTKHGMEDGRWSNQSYNKSELKRLYYIKEKKAMQREEQLKRENMNKKLDEEVMDGPVKNNKKRVLKSHQANNFNSSNSDSEGNSEEASEKGKNFYKNKKKK
jgi:hypothetical protein